MATDRKRGTYPVVRWIWVTGGHVVFAFIGAALLVYCFTSGNAVYPQGVPAAQWQSKVVMFQLAGILCSFILYTIWNIIFSYGCVGAGGHAHKTAKWLLPLMIIFSFVIAAGLNISLFVYTDAIKNFVVAPMFCSLVLFGLPLSDSVLFWLSVWLFSPDAVKYIGPYKQWRPSYLGG